MVSSAINLQGIKQERIIFPVFFVSLLIMKLGISKYMNRMLLLSLTVVINTSVWSQSGMLSINKEDNLLYEALLLQKVDSFHSCIYPRIKRQVINYQTVQEQIKMVSKSTLFNYLSNEALIRWFNQSTSISPILNLESGISNTALNNPSIYGSGIRLQSDINKKLNFNISVFGAKQRFNTWQQKQIDSTRILPHFGTYNAKLNGAYVYTDWRGSVAYQASSFIHIQAGKDFNFWGDGYRSLILSDNAVSHPFLRIALTAGKLQYMVLYQFLKDIDTASETIPNEKKYSTSHFLSWNIFKRFNIYLFESVIWRDKFPNGGHRGYDFNYINPIVFFRPIEHSLGSPDNYLMGGGFRARLFNNTHFYGQLILDEFKLKEVQSGVGWWANKYGYQLGLKIYNLFAVRNLYLMGEYNMVRPFTYSHGNSMENYGHMYQPLAHPMGSNFKELITLLNYRKGRWQFQLKSIYTKVGLDKDSTNYGQNIYRSYKDNRNDYGNTVLQGELTNLIQAEIKASYILNPLWHARLESGFRVCNYSNSTENVKQSQVFIGLRTMF